MTCNIESDVAEYVDKVGEISKGDIQINRFDNYFAIDFRIDLPGSRETASSLVVDRRGVRIIEIRLPSLWKNTSQMRAQRRLDGLIHEAGFPVRTYTYVRRRTMNPHIRLENPDMSEEELFSLVTDLIEKAREIQEESP